MEKNNDKAVILFARDPVLGHVKTRLSSLLDDEMGVYKYPYYTRTTNIFDVQMTEDFSKYILSPARYYDNRSKDDLRNVNTSNNASLWRAQLGFRYNFNF